MSLASVKAGDLVLCDIKGRRFHALVVEKLDRQLRIMPLDSRISYRSVKSREVVDHWHHARRKVAAHA